jgi:hypothetical protein
MSRWGFQATAPWCWRGRRSDSTLLPWSRRWRVEPPCLTDRVRSASMSCVPLTGRHRRTIRQLFEGVEPTDRETLKELRGWGWVMPASLELTEWVGSMRGRL